MRYETSSCRPQVLIACLCLAIGDVTAGEWPTYHGGFALTGVSPDSFPKEPPRLWRTKVGKGYVSSVVGGDGRLFCIADKTTVAAIDAKGVKIWHRVFEQAGGTPDEPAQRKQFVAPPLYASTSLLVVAADDGTVYGLSPADGKTRWTYAAEGRIQGSPSYTSGGEDGPDRVLVMTQPAGILHGVNAADGKKLWISDPMERTDGHIAVAEGKAIFGNCASTFFALDVLSGKQVAAIEIEEGAEMAGGVSVSGGQVYGGNRGGSIVGGDLGSGKVNWVFNESQGELFTTPAVAQTRIVFCGGDAVVYCVARDSGKLVWKYDTTATQPLSPVIAGRTIIAAADGTLFGLKLDDGKPLWKLVVSDEIADPSIVDGMILIGMDDGHVAAFGPGEE